MLHGPLQHVVSVHHHAAGGVFHDLRQLCVDAGQRGADDVQIVIGRSGEIGVVEVPTRTKIR